MLRVGLTGGLGSGKSTVGRMFAALGAAVIDADEVGRGLMQPGQQVYDRIVKHFGQQVVQADGSLDRRALAELAFDGGQVAEQNRRELNRIVHPATISAQEEWMRRVFASDPDSVAMVESALVFEASGGLPDRPGAAGSVPALPSVPGWKDRFDRIILVTAPDDLKIQRFVGRSADRGRGDPATLAREARKRLAAQIPDAQKATFSDWVIDNSGDIGEIRATVADIYAQLKVAAAVRSH
jgi:dephospho-CoA kinase